MPILLLAAFIGVPLLEIAVFIQVGGVIGLWPTLALVVLTAMVGTHQLRAQGLATLARARAEMDRGNLPTRELFDGACLLIAGVLLLTPGFVTDTVGLLLFVPAVRNWLRRALAKRLKVQTQTRIFVDGVEIDPDAGPGPRGRGPIIDGDYDDVTPRGRGPLLP
ncbi:MAG: FxsA family protein [Alphaproteobacteria bacterium]|nr:MAG: FxsA family protein [Alphaproteobacteria bacterium]